MDKTRALVLIPAYNEEDTIEEIVRRSMVHCDVCVVDDGSTDRTADILATIDGVHTVRHTTNTRIAAAVVDGMRYALSAGYDWVITMDAGLSHNPDELKRFLNAEDADLVIGARASDRVEGAPLYRRALSRAGTILLNRVLTTRRRGRNEKLSDCSSGYRRYSRRAMQVITETPLRSTHFDFLLESLALIDRASLSIEEVPISYVFSNSSLNWKSVVDALRMWWHLRGDVRRLRASATS